MINICNHIKFCRECPFLIECNSEFENSRPKEQWEKDLTDRIECLKEILQSVKKSNED